MMPSHYLFAEKSNTPVISYASTASVLSDKRQHPYFFRVVPADYHESKALLELLSKYDFKGVSSSSFPTFGQWRVIVSIRNLSAASFKIE